MLRTIRSRLDSWQNKISDESVEVPENTTAKKVDGKLSWYFAGGFVAFWSLLFFAVVIPLFYRLPTPLTMQDAGKNVFIAERAYNNLYTLSNIGTKLTGSEENEVEAVKFVLNELQSIKSVLLTDYFDFEYEISQATGGFPYSTTLNFYKGVQNIVAKLSPKNSTSENYLLINSHFDSKPYTNSAGDAGFMIVTMLEVLRVIATTKQPIENPLVFLFNGAEEGMLQASHGFVTSHKWAPHCKAVLNLDAGGSGGRDILFQSGPNHPWLVGYYKKYIKYPFATTMAEEIFQSGIIPSDTDFRQFNAYGNIPGLDMAQCINGFIYHTKYDNIDVIPLGSFQNTGDNVLSLVRGLANATELHNSDDQSTGHAVFFDFLGIYFFHYTNTTGKVLNFGISIAVFALVSISMWRMSVDSDESVRHVIRWFSLVFVIQITSFVLALVFPILVAYAMDGFGRSMTYYSTPLLIIGLYVCPSLIGLTLPITIYYTRQSNDKLSKPHHLQLALHSQAIILAILCIVVQASGFRSAYIFAIPLIFYVISLVLNLITTLHDRGYAWSALLKASQIVPFLYSSYIIYLFIVVLTPMGGRSGSASNRDLFIAVLAAIGTILSLGFMAPLISTLRRPRVVLYALLATTLVSIILASTTHLGFPYRPMTSGQRVAYLQVRNMFYEYDGTLSKDESGYLFSFQDRRGATPFKGTNVNLTGLVDIKSKCETDMMCGMPLYDYRYYQHRLSLKWLPRSEPIVPPGEMKLELLNKTIVNSTTARYQFQLSGSSHMSLFFQTYKDVKIINWSFVNSYLRTAQPYHVYLTYGIDDSPYNFSVDISKPDGDFNVPAFQLGASAHFIGHPGDDEAERYAASFPIYSILAQWPAIYKRYIF
ncbi:endoplasmic reticulum metallopeptidase 1-like [Drosophila albomicans]|uniref:FXNA-like protease n=1 Tax=Drosophila albomicans TaxID=7291 RepID=A0A6P8X0A0_DROAB|nr:endoplasmic reticulum metallopeptidase 1-like [Drosophila albomicans]